MTDEPKKKKRRARPRPKLVQMDFDPSAQDAELGRGKKLTVEQQEWAICRLAQFDSHDAVREGLAATFGVFVTKQAITKLAKNHPKAVQVARETYMRELCNTPLAFKRYRLDQLQALYEANDCDPELRLDVLKAASAEMRGPDLVAVVLGHGNEENEATEFLRDPRLGVGSIDVDRILRRREDARPDLLPLPGVKKK